MTPKQLIDHFGTPAKAAAARGLDRQIVHGWQKRKSIPIEQQIAYEVVTDGKLRADLPEQVRQPIGTAA